MALSSIIVCHWVVYLCSGMGCKKTEHSEFCIIDSERSIDHLKTNAKLLYICFKYNNPITLSVNITFVYFLP